jgi:hypothetical protein
MSKQLKKRIKQSRKSLLGGGEYRFIDNGSKVLGVAHVDHVDCGSNHFFRSGHRVWSSRLDDRLGVHVLLDILPKMGIVVDVLLTDNEEIGQSTAELFKPSKDYNWMFQFDRHGTDAVCYQYRDMEEVVKDYFRVGRGSFSDISLMDHLGCGGVNVGTAYYEEHTLGSHGNLKELAAQLEAFKRFYDNFRDVHVPGDEPKLLKPKKRDRKPARRWDRVETVNLDDVAPYEEYEQADCGCWTRLDRMYQDPFNCTVCLQCANELGIMGRVTACW